VTVSFETSLAAVQTFYQLLCKTRTRHGLPPQPWGFFANVHRHVIGPGGGFVAIAHWKGVPVAGAVFFASGTRLLYKFAASDETYQHVRGNNLVIWRTIEFYARKGYTSLDFGRTSLTNDGLRRFKLAWHAEERAINYFRYNVKNRTVIPTPDKATEGLHTRVFRSLPQPLTRLIGTAAYKHLG
jgi:lipid II:glycine glycyltransferase (peptidoglycan interpeptide bridge formation enzyme)